jgi:hypothetical protein
MSKMDKYIRFRLLESKESLIDENIIYFFINVDRKMRFKKSTGRVGNKY